MDWFRSYHGAPTDPKWLVIGRQAGVEPGVVAAVWWALMDHASQARPRGSVASFDEEAVAAFFGWPEEHIDAVVEALKKRRMIEDGFLSAWLRRNPADYSTERVRAHRTRKTPTPATSETDETLGNAGNAGKHRGEEIEEKREKRITPTAADAAVPPAAELVTLLGNGGAEALEAIANGRTANAVRVIRQSWLYEDDKPGATPDVAVKGKPLHERRDMVARALVEMEGDGKRWNPALFAGFVRNLRYQPPARAAPSSDLTEAQFKQYLAIRQKLEAGGMAPDEAAREADKQAREAA